ncbi:hypothetical protein ACWC09_48140 [Streptomyces sp. NPDC001617]
MIFEGRPHHSIEQIRGALALPATSPVCVFDARERVDCRDVLLGLVDHVLAKVSGPMPAAR